MQTKYWYVFRRWGNAPTFRHPSYDSAVREAQRLIEERIEGEYEILEAVALVKEPPKFIVEKFVLGAPINCDPQPDDIPF